MQMGYMDATRVQTFNEKYYSSTWEIKSEEEYIDIINCRKVNWKALMLQEIKNPGIASW